MHTIHKNKNIKKGSHAHHIIPKLHFLPSTILKKINQSTVFALLHPQSIRASNDRVCSGLCNQIADITPNLLNNPPGWPLKNTTLRC